MWLEKNRDLGIRYEIDSIEDACEIIVKIVKEMDDKNHTLSI